MNKREKVFLEKLNAKPWGKDYIIKSAYKNENKNVWFYHKPCGHLINIRPSHLLEAERCKYCFYKKHVVTFAGLIKKLNHVPNGKHYVPNKKSFHGMRHNCKFVHTICGHTLYMTPANLVTHLKERGRDCEYCNRKHRMHTTAWFAKKVNKMTKGKYSVASKYRGYNNKITIRHNTKHPHTFKTTPNNFIAGRRCPLLRQSYGESYMIEKLKSYGLKLGKDFQYGYHLHSKKETGHVLHEDILLTFKYMTVGVEFDGQQHYYAVSFGCKDWSEVLVNFFKEQHRDVLKDIYMHLHDHKQIRIGNPNDIHGRRLRTYVYKEMDKKVLPVINKERAIEKSQHELDVKIDKHLALVNA